MADDELLDPVVLRVLQVALLRVSEAMTGVSEATPTIEEQLEAMAAIRDGADRALRSIVTDARHAGLPWADIGRALNVTRQSAYERYSGKDDDWFWLG